LKYVENNLLTLLNGRTIDRLLRCLHIGEAVAHSALPAATNQRRPSLTHALRSLNARRKRYISPLLRLYQPSREQFFRADIGRSYDNDYY